MASKLERLLKQQSQINARVKQESAIESTKKRKLDTKMKILIGAYFKKKHEDENTWSELVQLMDDSLTHKSDRTAFNLPPRPEEAKNKMPETKQTEVA